MAIIPQYVHSCIVQRGDMAGNKVLTTVSSWDYEFGNKCDYCGELLVTTEQLIAHIYMELTE